MGWFKNICTCVGCAIGAVCIVATGGAATPLVTAAAIGIGGTAGYLIGDKKEKDEKKIKNQEQDLALKNQTIQELSQDNKKEPIRNHRTKKEAWRTSWTKTKRQPRLRKCQKQS